MSAVLTLLAILFGIVFLGQLAIRDRGYVLISRAPHEVEISLALFFVSLVILVIVIYFTVRFLIRVFFAPRDLGRWRDRRNVLLARKATLDGYARLIEGDWQSAERILTQRLSYSATPLLDCLGAAFAAQQQGNQETRDQYQERAKNLDPDHH